MYRRIRRCRGPIRELFWTHETNESLGNWLNKRTRLQQKDPDTLFVSTCSANVGKRFSIKGVGEMLRRYSNRARIPEHVIVRLCSAISDRNTLKALPQSCMSVQLSDRPYSVIVTRSPTTSATADPYTCLTVCRTAIKCAMTQWRLVESFASSA